MSSLTSLRLGKRPVFLADYGKTAPKLVVAETASIDGETVKTSVKKPGIRYNFPSAGEEFEGGCTVDGYCYRISFAAGRLERSYDMVRAFLAEQGYGDLPLPDNAQQLRLFRLPPKFRHQLSLFGDNGYVHNPIKILFPVPAGRAGELVLELYNESTANHLIRFHRG